MSYSNTWCIIVKLTLTESLLYNTTIERTPPTVECAFMLQKVIQKFKQWSKLKLKIHLYQNTTYRLYFKEKQIWWASVGQNIGVEANGKHNNFERPVLILKKFNEKAFLGVTLSTKVKTGRYYFKLSKTNAQSKQSFVNLSQLKLMSSQRLIRKVRELDTIEFGMIKHQIKVYL